VAELAYDHIESIVRKREVLNICLEPFDLNLCDAGVLASIFQKFGCEVSSIDQGSIARGGDSYNSSTAADVQDSVTGADSGEAYQPSRGRCRNRFQGREVLPAFFLSSFEFGKSVHRLFGESSKRAAAQCVASQIAFHRERIISRLRF